MKEVYFLYNSNSRINIFLQVLGEGNFHLLTHHVVIGNQVIIRGSYKETIKLILHALMVSVYIKKNRFKTTNQHHIETCAKINFQMFAAF